MIKMIIHLWLILGVCCLVKSEGYYSVIAPGSLRPNSPYHVAVGIHNTDTPVKVKLELAADKLIHESHIITVDPESTKIAIFDVADVPFAEYRLCVEGLEGMQFRNETYLNYDERAVSIFVQTDKSVYKPGDLVRFRVLFLHADGRPLNVVKSTRVLFKDPNGIVVMPFKVETLNIGVYENQFQLSAIALLGQWEIFVNGKPTASKNFKVEEYVLPKFEVTVDVPDEVVWPKLSFTVIVKAKYTFGQYVKGEAKITVGDETRIVPLDGKAVSRFEMKMFDGWRWKGKPIPIHAEVTETTSGLKQSAETTATVYTDKYVIKKVNVPKYVPIDGPTNLEFKVTNHKDVPVLDTHDPVQLVMSVNQDRTSKVALVDEQYLDKKGVVTFNIDLRKNLQNITNWQEVPIWATVSFKYSHDLTLNLDTRTQRAKVNRLMVNIQTERPTMQDEVSVEVLNTEPMNHFIYHVVAKGKIVLLNKVEVPNKSEFTFKFVPTVDMFPSATVFVYYVSKNGDFMFAEEDLSFKDQLKNFLKVKINSEAKPGENVGITVITEPNSFVGLLGVDQSVLLQEDKHDFKLEAFTDEFGKYQTVTHFPEPIRIKVRYYGDPTTGSVQGRNREVWWPGQNDEHLKTRDHSKPYPGEKSGLITLTNANFPFWAISTPQPPSYHTQSAYASRTMAPFPMPQYASSDYVAGQAGQAQTISRAPVTVRKEFPETWLWESFSNISGGQATFSKKVPDTITSWIITGFSVSPEHGVGLMKSPKKLTVFQRFFISMNLPYSVINDEVISVPVIVFNYMSEDVKMELEFLNEDKEFTFTDKGVEDPGRGTSSRLLTVPADSTKVVHFTIRPKKVGDIILKARANSDLAGDLIEKVLLVKPEGVPKYFNKAVLITKEIPDVELEVTLPEKAVADSLFVEFSVGRDALASAINNLHQLVRMPHGCGEQNLVNFVPNYLVLQYLSMKNYLSEDIRSKALNYLRIGYQAELGYRHSDGSFSAFGMSDRGGSTWLTAYVARCFTHAAKYIEIDENVIKEAFTFLSLQQAHHGGFPEVGVVVDRKYATIQGGDVVLTAFTLIGFLENPNAREKYKDKIKQGLAYLENRSASENDLNDPFALAIVTYVFQLADHKDLKDVLLDRLLSSAKHGDGTLWWTNPAATNSDTYDEEATAYALLALLESSKADQSSSVARWLVSRQKSTGGFSSTQSTVVAFTGLIKYSEKFLTDGPFIVNFKDDLGAEHEVSLHDTTPGYFRTFQLSPNVRKISVKGSGDSAAIVQLSYSYNVIDEEKIKPFLVVPIFEPGSTAEVFTLSVCTRTTPGKDGPSETSMAVMEVKMPSGYSINKETLDTINHAKKNYKKVETRSDATVAVFYFDKLDANEICVKLQANRVHKVAKQKPAHIFVYDYYDSDRRTTTFYSPPKSTLCDICDPEDCASTCTQN